MMNLGGVHGSFSERGNLIDVMDEGDASRARHLALCWVQIEVWNFEQSMPVASKPEVQRPANMHKFQKMLE